MNRLHYFPVYDDRRQNFAMLSIIETPKGCFVSSARPVTGDELRWIAEHYEAYERKLAAFELWLDQVGLGTVDPSLHG